MISIESMQMHGAHMYIYIERERELGLVLNVDIHCINIYIYIYDIVYVCTYVFKNSNNIVISHKGVFECFDFFTNDFLTNKLIRFLQVVMVSQVFTGVSRWNFLITVVTHNPYPQL